MQSIVVGKKLGQAAPLLALAIAFSSSATLCASKSFAQEHWLIADTESGGFTMSGSSSESGGVFSSASSSQSGGMYESGSSQQGGGVSESLSASQGGTINENASSSQSGGFENSGSSSQSGGSAPQGYPPGSRLAPPAVPAASWSAGTWPESGGMATPGSESEANSNSKVVDVAADQSKYSHYYGR
jgi:hypothetical protein